MRGRGGPRPDPRSVPGTGGGGTQCTGAVVRARMETCVNAGDPPRPNTAERAEYRLSLQCLAPPSPGVSRFIAVSYNLAPPCLSERGTFPWIHGFRQHHRLALRGGHSRHHRHREGATGEQDRCAVAGGGRAMATGLPQAEDAREARTPGSDRRLFRVRGGDEEATGKGQGYVHSLPGAPSVPGLGIRAPLPAGSRRDLASGG